MKRVASFLTGATIGGLVGAALAILIAPASGQDLRTQIQNRVDRVRHEMQAAAARQRAELEAELEALRAPRS